MAADNPLFVRSETLKVDPERLRANIEQHNLGIVEGDKLIEEAYKKRWRYQDLIFGWAIRKPWVKDEDLVKRYSHRTPYYRHTGPNF